MGRSKAAADKLFDKGFDYYQKSEWKQALNCWLKAKKTYEELGYQQMVANTYNNLGLVYADMGEWPKAIEFYQKSLETSEKLGDKAGISETLKNLGEINIKNGNWDEAETFFEKSLIIAQELAPLSTVEILSNLGELSGLEDKYDKAISFLNKALEIARTAGAKPVEIDILQKLADVHLSRYLPDKGERDISSAREFFDKSHELAISMNMRMQEGIALRGIGIILAKKGDIKGSRNQFTKSIELFNQLGALFELQKTYLEYSRILYENGFIIEAEIAAKSAAFDSKRNDFRELLIKAYLLLGDISMKNRNQYEYYLEALEVAEFNPKIFVRTCYHLVFRMKKMETQMLLNFIGSLKKQNKDKVFNRLLETLDAKIQGKYYDMAEIPGALVQEIEGFQKTS